MIANLVRIQLLKIKHSKFFKWSAVASVLVAAIAFCLIVFWLTDRFDHFLDSPDNNVYSSNSMNKCSFWTLEYINFIMGLANIVVTGTAISLICNHYENREKINVAGVVRSPAKWFTSELIAICILCVGSAFVVVSTGLLIGKASGFDYPEFLKDPNRVLLLWLAMSIAVFIDIGPAIYLSKWIRTTAMSAYITIAVIVAKMFIFIIGSGFLVGALDLVVDEALFISTVQNPGTGILTSLIGRAWGMSKRAIIIYTSIRVALIAGLGYLATRRKSEL